MKRLRGYLFILAGTVFWGLSAVVAKIIFTRVEVSSRPIDPLILVQTRVSLSCVVMLLFFLLFKPAVLRVQLRDIPRMFLLGVFGIAGSNITYYIAIQQINVSTAILMQYTAPLLVLAYSTLTKEESLNTTKTAAALLSIIGCFFAVGGVELSFGHLSSLGLIAGAGAALCWAFTNIYLRHLLKDYSVWTVLACSFLAASIFWLFINPPWKVAAMEYSPEQWLQFLGFAMISVLIPHSLYFMGVRYIAASRAIITATFEPIVAIAGSFLILGEELTPVQIIGAIVVIIAIAILQFKREESETLPRSEQQRPSP
jgi:DME family drug/metabolite transporter